MARLLLLIPLLLALASCAGADRYLGGDSGTFRGNWWNYYDRALEEQAQGDLAAAIADLRSALALRAEDSWRARTYGMHLTDYFPHRELGIAYLQRGDLTAALGELELSLRQAESAKGDYFLNRTRRELLLKQGNPPPAPEIALNSPAGDLAVRESHLKVAGLVRAAGYLARLSVDGVPVPLDLARQEVAFEREVALGAPVTSVVVSAEDLLGSVATRTLTVRLDQEGPLVAVEEAAPALREGRRVISVQGEVSDPSGIRSLTVNGVPVATRGAELVPLSLQLDEPPGGRLVIRAEDTLGNVTRAEVDLTRNAAGLERRPAAVQVAFNGSAILSSDREKPSIWLKGASGLPELYVDKYFLEGEVSDDQRVDRVLINGREVSARKGKRIFFSKLVELREGRNRITVTAYDARGNMAEEVVTVTRRIPAVLQQGSRMALTVLPFDGKGKGTASQMAVQYLMANLVEQKRFVVVERDKLEQVLRELKLSKAKLTDPKHSLRIGRLLSADALVASTVNDAGKSLEIVSRVINAETAEDMAFVDVFAEDREETSVRELMAGLAAKLARQFPLLEGSVVKADQSRIYSSLAGDALLHRGAGVIIYRKGPEVTDPGSGRSLGFETVKVAEGRIEEVQKGFSKVRLVEKDGKSGVRPSDLIITK